MKRFGSSPRTRLTLESAAPTRNRKMDDNERHIAGVINTNDDIPSHFKSEDEEAEFWETHEFSTEYIRAHRIPREQSPIARIMAKRAADAGRAAAISRPAGPTDISEKGLESLVVAALTEDAQPETPPDGAVHEHTALYGGG